MDIHEMIIKGNILLQRINSNAYQNIYPEEWCDMINMAISEFVRNKSYDPPETGRDNYDIINWYEGINSLIRTYTCNYPSVYPYYDNAKFLNLKSIAEENNPTGSAYISKPPITSGKMYRIVRLYGTDSFLTYGATNSEEGEIFTCNFNASVQPIMSSGSSRCVLTYLLGEYTSYLTTLKAGIVYSILQGNVTFPVGYSLKVTVDGVDYWLAGTNQNRTTDLVVNVGSKFCITEVVSLSTVWTLGSILEGVNDCETFFKFVSARCSVAYTCNSVVSYKNSPVDMKKGKDIQAIRNYSRGAVIHNPLGILENMNLVVFDNKGVQYVRTENQFDINTISVTYIKTPARVSISANISCDLDEIVHEQIVRSAVDNMTAAINADSWEKLKTESIQNKNIE